MPPFFLPIFRITANALKYQIHINMEKMEKKRGADGRVSLEGKIREWERKRLRAKIDAVRGLLPEYGGRTIDNVLVDLEAVYAYRYGGKKAS